PNEQTTHGINKIAWHNVQTTQGEPVTVNIWDFGGQHLQHSLHQFFFSERVLYILVVSPRTLNNTHYWVEQVKNLGGDSTILVVYNSKNEKDTEAAFEKEFYELQKKYTRLKKSFIVCCGNGTGIDQLREQLALEIQQLPDVATGYPANWYEIKKAIEEKVKLKQDNFYVHYDEYRNICIANDYPEEDKQKRLLVQLDQIGSIVFFDRPNVDHLQVLNPEWITTGAYTILTSEITKNNNGYLTLTDLKNIFKEEKEIFSDARIKIRYQSHDIKYITGLMQEYNLCVENPFDKAESYLVPAALTGLPVKDYTVYKTNSRHYLFEFDAPFEMLIMHRFIARNLEKARQEDFWQSGILIKDDHSDTYALVETDLYSKVINFWISGNEIRGFWESIRRDMKHICKIYKNLQPAEKVLYEHEGRSFFVSYNTMLNFLRKGIREAPLEIPGNDIVTVDVLLALENFRSKVDIQQLLKEIKFDVNKGFREIKEDNNEIKNKLDAQNKQILQLLTLSQQAQNDLQQLLEKVDAGFSEEKANTTLKQIENAIAEQFNTLPEQIAEEWNKLSAKSNDGVDIKAKLKFKVPIIPFLLEYEGELAADMKKLGKKLRKYLW
ncbi:MAG: hypothetical protein JNM68_17390, partial [Dinghuibacter sp.]|nr:hypothetical protein [Dinghuibacter sp.]